MQKTLNREQSFRAHYLTVKLTSVLVLLATLSACATVQQVPMSQDISANLAGKKVVTAVYPMPGMTDFTAGAAAFALVGAIVAMEQGKGILRDNQIEDPALNINEQLSRQLVASRGMVPISNKNAVATDDDIPTLMSTYQGADYLLDVKTMGMMIHYYPTDWTHYRFTYIARVRLIDLATHKIIAQERCNSTEGNDNKPPTMDELLLNKASLLKYYMHQAGNGCVNVVSKDILGLPVTEETRRAVSAVPEKPVNSFIGINHAAAGPAASPVASPAVGLAASPAPVKNASPWKGAMSCGARKGMPDKPAYQARFAMEIDGTEVTVHRRTDRVTEALSGVIGPNGTLQLRGIGLSNAAPDNRWELAIDGELAPGARNFSGKGGMILNGEVIRDCELVMTNAPVLNH